MFKHRVWRKLEKELDERNILFNKLTQQIKDDGLNHHHVEVAATDLFVEKAQVYLTWRARFLTNMGFITAMVAVIIFLTPAIILITNKDFSPPDYAKIFIKEYDVKYVKDKSQEVTVYHGLTKNQFTYVFYLMLLRNSAIGGAFVASAGFLIYLSRSCFHEATILYNRRHALRFGRLFVYLKTAGNVFTIDELEMAFKWTDEYSTAFKELKPESNPSQSMIPGLSMINDIIAKFKEDKEEIKKSGKDTEK
jgi:hypothetical protein